MILVIRRIYEPCARIWRHIKPFSTAMLIGVLAGVLLSFATPWAWIDSVFPVVSMNAMVIQKMPTEIVVKLAGRKNRDCKYEGVRAYSQVGDLLRDLNMERIDKPAESITRPVGHFDFGTWRVWPTTTTKTMVIYIQYDCSGRDVHVRAVEVAL